MSDSNVRPIIVRSEAKMNSTIEKSHSFHLGCRSGSNSSNDREKKEKPEQRLMVPLVRIAVRAKNFGSKYGF
jgi:hypothetical protein